MINDKMLAECRAHWEKTKPDAVFPDYWLGWQASRESLVIDLPERDTHELSINAMFGYDLARKDAKRSTEAVGLKVKP